MPDTHIPSLNFSFIAEHDLRLADYASRAEANAWSDPNTSLIKVRQFGELLAEHTAARFALDLTELDFQQLITSLWKKRFIPFEIREQFDNVRHLGNDAVHQHRADQHSALRGLIAAHILAAWFHRTFADSDFDPGPFRPLPDPDDVEVALRDELATLRQKAAEELACVRGELDNAHSIQSQLEEENANRYQALQDAHRRLIETVEQQQADREESQRRLLEAHKVAQARTPKAIRTLLKRSEDAANALRRPKFADHLPLGQLRLLSPQNSRCCKSPAILVGTDDGFVQTFCTECGDTDRLTNSVYKKLALWVDCPKCRQRMEPADRVETTVNGKTRYRHGFKCKCRHKILLSSLLPRNEDLDPHITRE